MPSGYLYSRSAARRKSLNEYCNSALCSARRPNSNCENIGLSGREIKPDLRAGQTLVARILGILRDKTNQFCCTRWPSSGHKHDAMIFRRQIQIAHRKLRPMSVHHVAALSARSSLGGARPWNHRTLATLLEKARARGTARVQQWAGTQRNPASTCCSVLGGTTRLEHFLSIGVH